MALEIEGKIIRKLNVQNGTSARGEWARQEFVVEYQEGNYPAQAAMNVWGVDKVKDLEKYQIGDNVKVSFNIASREYNGRWYTDLRVWKMELVGTTPENFTPSYAPTGAEGTGSNFAPNATEAASTNHGFVDNGDQSEDDLPF